MKVAAGLLVILALLIAIVPMFTDCESQGRTLTTDAGKTVSMKCHWTGRAELALGIPLLGVGILVGVSRRRETRRALGVLAALLGVVAILLPTELIGVCMNPDMPCVGIMKPALILMGALVVAIGVAVTALSWGPGTEGA
jgi:hypothetical protein